MLKVHSQNQPRIPGTNTNQIKDHSSFDKFDFALIHSQFFQAVAFPRFARDKSNKKAGLVCPAFLECS